MIEGLKPSFSLLDLIAIEQRKKLLNSRRDKLLKYKWSRIHIEYENGMAARMYINPYIKSGKADKIIRRIDVELSRVNKILKHFL
jgi:hypothetical protein